MNRLPVAARIAALALLIAVLAISLALILARPAETRAFARPDDPDVLVIAHQGGNHLWPDDTLFAFQNAVNLGADVLEMDTHMSADGVLVVIHDETVDRTTDGTGLIKEMTLAEIQALDAGYRWQSPSEDIRAQYSEDYPYRAQGIYISTLEEIFERFPETRMNIEIKQSEPPIGETLCGMIRAYGREDDVLIASFSHEAMLDFRAQCPEIATSSTQDEMIVFYVTYRLFLGQSYSPAFQAVQVPRERFGLTIMTPRFVRAAHGRGVEVHTWTINERESMQELIDMGVDGIITDRPDRLLDLLGRQ